MYFENVEQILHMKGHGAFVWSAYLITTAVVTGVLIAPLRRRRLFLRQMAGELKRSQGAPNSTQEEI